ncbi:MAG TPA: bifunctional DNA-formamidopyrimidine glycosylase/DNA-(apurinic or apyrimidinic site) lyase [Stellaceae bacterium]|jgi:formamidopyrimidine-DNA glycosylase|nr:bifunctional DNA-formamidopyrimidine glycosylase/DNA-(apurinic or apyrimidinic site) lyase [Stellaceae bacterium]
MPELPEVETVRRGLALKMSGRRIVRAELRRPDLRRPFPPELAERLGGAQIGALRRRGKYILIELDADDLLLLHLGMSGRITAGDAAQPDLRHDHVVLTLDDGTVVRFNDARRFGTLDYLRRSEADRHPLLAGLGPEPLEAGFDGAYLAHKLAGKMTPIKAALLDQRIVAGLGNIYVCEALYRARLSPRRLAGTIGRGRAERLVAAIRAVLDEAIEAGGSSLRNYVQANGELGYFQHRWAVYGHEGEPCPGCTCAEGVRRITQSGRSTFFCARRQR